jgi:protein TonB
MQSGIEPQSGYLASRKSPVGFGGAIAVHVIAATVILLMPKEMIDYIVPKPIWTSNIPLPKDPPPPDQPRKEKQQTMTMKLVERPSTIPKVIVPTLPDGPKIEIPAGDSLPGSGGSTIPLDPPRTPVLVDAMADPRFADDFQPNYPPSMQRAQMEGSVMVRIVIGADGRVKAIEKLSATSDAFWDATRQQALRKWRFRPATRDGVVVETQRTMTVRFRLS